MQSLRLKHSKYSPLLLVIEWLLVLIACAAVLFAIWSWLPITHTSPGALLLFQTMQAILLFMLPPLMIAYLWNDQPMQWLHLTSNRHSYQSTIMIILSIAIMISAIPVINALAVWNRMIRLPESLQGLEQLMLHWEQSAEQMLQSFLTWQNGAWQVLILNIIVLAMLPAIGEELTFRGLLQNILVGKDNANYEGRTLSIRTHAAVWLTAFIFSFIHFQFYGFLPRLLLGALLGYALAWSGKIHYSIIMHATNNTLSVILFYLATYVWNISSDSLDALGTGHTWWLTLVCTPVLCILILLFYRLARSNR